MGGFPGELARIECLAPTSFLSSVTSSAGVSRVHSVCGASPGPHLSVSLTPLVHYLAHASWVVGARLKLTFKDTFYFEVHTIKWLQGEKRENFFRMLCCAYTPPTPTRTFCILMKLHSLEQTVVRLKGDV